jgi:hypothetical protein
LNISDQVITLAEVDTIGSITWCTITEGKYAGNFVAQRYGDTVYLATQSQPTITMVCQTNDLNVRSSKNTSTGNNIVGQLDMHDQVVTRAEADVEGPVTWRTIAQGEFEGDFVAERYGNTIFLVPQSQSTITMVCQTHDLNVRSSKDTSTGNNIVGQLDMHDQVITRAEADVEGPFTWRTIAQGEFEGDFVAERYGNTIFLIKYNPDDMVELPTLTRILYQGIYGNDVKALQQILTQLGYYSGPITGYFGPLTEETVKAYQQWAGVATDGVVGPQTWEELGGEFDVDKLGEAGVRLQIAAVAQMEAAKQLRWTDMNCEAEKYLAPWRDVIGMPDGFFDWCSAFVAWCCREVGIEIPDRPEGFWGHMAFVDSWRIWAQAKGYWFDKYDDTPQRGDIAALDWERGSESIPYPLDHLAVVSSYEPDSGIILTYEGNKSNQTKASFRYMSYVVGFIRITTGNE